MENHHFYWENSLYMAIFNSYVSSPEGRTHDSQVDGIVYPIWRQTQIRHEFGIPPKNVLEWLNLHVQLF